MSYLLWRTESVTIATAAGTTFTHSLSRATANLHVLLTGHSPTTLSLPFCVTVTPNTVVVGATGVNAITDIAVLEFHSIQGGPTGLPGPGD